MTQADAPAAPPATQPQRSAKERSQETWVNPSALGCTNAELEAVSPEAALVRVAYEGGAVGVMPSTPTSEEAAIGHRVDGPHVLASPRVSGGDETLVNPTRMGPWYMGGDDALARAGRVPPGGRFVALFAAPRGAPRPRCLATLRRHGRESEATMSRGAQARF